MEFKCIRRVLSCTRRAVDKYNMIEEGDRIAVAVSGGKDSVALLAALVNLRLFYPKKYTVCALTVDMGFEGQDFSPLVRFCNEIDVEYRIIRTRLAQVIFEERQESNPCSLCARMRRGILHDAGKEMGCGKIALGHHFDDTVDTFMLNLFYEGRLGSFLPVTYLSRKDITVIRPFVYLPEKDIAYFLSKNCLPVIKSACPEDKHTEREAVHRLISDLDRKNKGLRHRIFTAMEQGGLFVQEEE